MEKVLHKNLISIFLLMGVITLAFCGTASYIQYFRLAQSYNDLIESYQTIRAANQSLISIDAAELSVGDFLQTRDNESLTQVPQLIIAARVNFETLKQLVSDNAIQTQLSNTVSPLFADKIIFFQKIINESAAGHINQAMQIASDKNRLRQINEITRLIIAIKQEEIRQLNATNIDLKVYRAQTRKILMCIGMLSGLLFLCCFYFLNGYLKRY